MELVATALRQTEAVIDQYGWRKHGFGNCTDGFCLLGALQYAILGSVKKKTLSFTDAEWDVFIGAVRILHQAMVDGFPKDANKSVAMWNDMDGRTEKEVRALLRRTIATIETTT